MMGHKKRFYGNLANYPYVISFTPSYLEGALLVGWFIWAKRPFETVFQSISGRLPERGRKKKRNDRREK